MALLWIAVGNLFGSKLGFVRGLWNIPWCADGDFNVVRFLANTGKGGECLRL